MLLESDAAGERMESCEVNCWNIYNLKDAAVITLNEYLGEIYSKQRNEITKR